MTVAPAYIFSIANINPVQVLSSLSSSSQMYIIIITTSTRCSWCVCDIATVLEEKIYKL